MRVTVLFLVSLLLFPSVILAALAEVAVTGQTACYDSLGAPISCAGTGQDGDIQAGIALPSPRFIDNLDGTVADRLTGLNWAQDASSPTFSSCVGGDMTWQGSLDYVTCLNNNLYLGYNDWVLPNRNELESLVDLGQNNPAMATGSPFINVLGGLVYWSSTNSYATSDAWKVNMFNGQFFRNGKAGSGRAWPVRETLSQSSLDLPKTGQVTIYAAGDDGDLKRGITWPGPRFTLVNSIVTDNLTGLAWAQDASGPDVAACTGGESTWQEALDYVDCLNGQNYLGFNDWRLPNINALKSLTDVSQSSPALPVGHLFTSIQSGGYWSSNSVESYPDGAWVLYPSQGHILNTSKTSLSQIWPVRGGPLNEAPISYEVTPLFFGAFGSISPDVVEYVREGEVASFEITTIGGFEIESVIGCGGTLNGTTYTTAPIMFKCEVAAIIVADIDNDGASGEKETLWGTSSTDANAFVPQTGQVTCYDASGGSISCAGTGQDGDIKAGVEIPEQRFTHNPDGTSTDALTGLIWMTDNTSPTVGSCVGGIKSWQSALDYVDCLNNENHLGYNDWILPNVNELKSLVNISLPTPQDNYWSSTTYALNTSVAWGVALSWGAVRELPKSGAYRVLPLRTAQTKGDLKLAKTGQTTSYATGDDGDLQRGLDSPAQRFTDNGDGTVIDNFTGLIWLKDANCFGSGTWQTALDNSYALTNGSCGLTDGSTVGDWRLPNPQEMGSLSDYSTFGPALPAGHPFTNVQSLPYFSSSSYVADGSVAWYVSMNIGNTFGTSKTNVNSTWPVRGGQFSFTYIVPSSGPNGSMTPSTVQYVSEGQNAIFDISPDTGYVIDTVSGCSGSLVGKTYTTSSLDTDCTVSASFVELDTDGDGSPDSTDTDDDNDGVSDVEELAMGTDPLVVNAFTPRTGQTTCYDAAGSVIPCAVGDDGYIRAGVNWPSPRFIDNSDGTVTDNLTGLIWLKNANCTDSISGIDKSLGYLTWSDALTWSNKLADGFCGLADGSAVGTWRLPNINELESLIDLGSKNPALPSGFPFTGVHSDGNWSEYWSSTTVLYNTSSAWAIDMWDGDIGRAEKSNAESYDCFVWPVR